MLLSKLGKRNSNSKLLFLENQKMVGIPTSKLKNDFACNALCELGASASIMPKRLYDLLDLKPLIDCSSGVRLVDSSIKRSIGRIDDILIILNDNYMPIDFLVLDIECDPSCPIILGRPFLRTIGAICNDPVPKRT